MAGVTVVPGKHEQLRMVGWLRWRLFVNRLRTVRGKVDLVARIIMGSGLATGTLGLGSLMAVGSWYALRHAKPLILAGELWLIFLVWLLFPILISGFGAESDPASLLRFPLRYSTFVLLAFAHGIFDPVAAAAVYWLLTVLLGIGLASPLTLLWAAPALAAFALLNLLLNRTIFAWLSRWMAQRRTREILGALFLLGMFSFQLTGPLARRYGKRTLPIVTHLASVGRILPPGMAAEVVTAKNRARAGAALTGLLAYSGVLLWLLSLRLRAEYRGESLSEARREAAIARPAVRAGWNVTGLSPTVAALLEKDLHYLLRNSMAYLTLLAPLLIIVVISLSSGTPHARRTFFILSSSTFFPMGVGYVMLTLVNFLYNNLGYDGPGMPMLLAAPIRFRDVLVAKNLLHSILVLAEVIAVFALVQLVSGPTPPLVVAVTLAGALWALLTNLAVGNLVSLYFPKKLNPGQMRRQQASGVAAAASFGSQVILAGLVTGICFLARWVGNLAWGGAAFLVLAGIAWAGYRYVLHLSSDIAWKRREALMAELSRPG